MDVREIRQMSDDALLDAIEDKKEEMFNLRFHKASGQLENTNAIRYAKRDMSRLYTVLNERKLAALVAGEEK